MLNGGSYFGSSVNRGDENEGNNDDENDGSKVEDEMVRTRIMMVLAVMMTMTMAVRITVMMFRLTISNGDQQKSVDNNADDSSELGDLNKLRKVTVLVFVSVQTNVKLSFSAYEAPELSTLLKPLFLKETTQKPHDHLPSGYYGSCLRQ